MSEIIYKYPIPVPEHGFATFIDMPKNAKILRVQVQHGQPMLWALVNKDMPLVPKKFEVIPTGVEIPKYIYDTVSDRVHVGTFQFENGGSVFHLFERKLRAD